jgi:hypothetical protein
MTREEFIKVLDKKGYSLYSYKIEGDKVIINRDGGFYLHDLTSLPPGVIFENNGKVYLESIISISPDVAFENDGDVFLNALTSISPGVEFMNGGDVYLESLTGDWFSYWGGNIEGIGSKRLLNRMISLGLFER